MQGEPEDIEKIPEALRSLPCRPGALLQSRDVGGALDTGLGGLVSGTVVSLMFPGTVLPE